MAVSKIGPFVGSLIVSTAAVIGVQNTVAQEKTDPIKTNKSTEKSSSMVSLYRTKLRAICELPENKLHEAQKVLSELQSIQERSGGLGAAEGDVMRASLPYCKKVLEKNLELLTNNDRKKQTIASNNLIALSKLFSWSRSFDYQRQMDTKEKCLAFIKEVVEKTNDGVIDSEQLEALIKSSQALLSLSWTSFPDQNPDEVVLECNKTYARWLIKQVDNSIKNKSKQNQKVLETVIRKEMSNFNRIHPFSRGELLKSLTEKYTELLSHNKTEPAFLYDAISNFTYLQDAIRHYDPETTIKSKEELKNSSVSLFYAVCSGIENLPESKEKQVLRTKLLETPAFFVHYKNEKKLNECIEYLSNIICKKENTNPEEFMIVIRSLLNLNYKDNWGDITPSTNWSPYLLHHFMANNINYFEENTLKIIDAYKKTNQKELKNKLKNEIIELYMFYYKVPVAGERVWSITGGYKCSGSINISPPELKSVYTKTHESIIQKVGEPLFQIILSDLENWTGFMQELHRLHSNSGINSGLIPDTSKITSLVKDQFVKSESRKDLQKLGKAISLGTLWSTNVDIKTNVKKEYNFFRGLSDISFKIGLKENDLSYFHKLTFDLIKILDGGDREFYKIYLPNCKFEIDKDGKINSNDLNALWKLRKKAFLTLAYSASDYSEYLPSQLAKVHRNAIVDLLEKRFEKYDRPESLVKTWGEQTAALVHVYSNTKDTLDESNIYVSSKLSFLKGQLFDGITKTYDIEGEKKTYITIPLFNRIIENEFIKLNPAENRKILYDIGKGPRSGEELREALFKEAPQLQGKYIEMRKQFALSLLTSLSEQGTFYVNDGVGYLRQLGFRDYEIRNITEALLDSREIKK